MHNTLRSYLEKELPRSDFEIHYHIGMSFTGETDFRLKGDGTYELWSTVTEGRLRKSYSGQIEVSRVEGAVREMLEARVWEVEHINSKQMLDDSEAIIEVRAANRESRVVLWVSEIREAPAFAKVQSALLSFVHDISNGEVFENGQ